MLSSKNSTLLLQISYPTAALEISFLAGFKIPRVGSTAPTDSIAVRGLPLLLTDTGVFLRVGSDHRGLIREQFSLSLNLLKRDNRLTLDALLVLPVLLTPLGASTSSRLLLGWSSGS